MSDLTVEDVRSAVASLKSANVVPTDDWVLFIHPRCSGTLWKIGLKYQALKMWLRTFGYLSMKEFWKDRPWLKFNGEVV